MHPPCNGTSSLTSIVLLMKKEQFNLFHNIFVFFFLHLFISLYDQNVISPVSNAFYMNNDYKRNVFFRCSIK